MSTIAPLLHAVLEAARARGLDQSQLAQRAGLRAETISRAKRRGSIDLKSLQALAGAVDLSLALAPAADQATQAPPARSPLADPRWGLAWSNPDAPAEVLVRKALAHGNYDLLLQAMLGHGPEAVRSQWQQVAPTLPARARQEVERKLRNIEKGLADAEA